jgi:hypothetical protein
LFSRRACPARSVDLRRPFAGTQLKKRICNRYWEMTAAELAEATKEFDEPFVAEKGRPMNAAERERERSFRMKLGQPKQGKGAKALRRQ